MKSAGYAVYDSSSNSLDVVRPGETVRRRIPCNNLLPSMHHVYGVQVQGDEIWVLVGPPQNQRPDRKFIYRFSSLTGGESRSI